MSKALFFFSSAFQTRWSKKEGRCWCTVRRAFPAHPPSAWRTWWRRRGCAWRRRSTPWGRDVLSSRPTSASWASCCSSRTRSWRLLLTAILKTLKTMTSTRASSSPSTRASSHPFSPFLPPSCHPSISVPSPPWLLELEQNWKKDVKRWGQEET